jgi:hypothetical protein
VITCVACHPTYNTALNCISHFTTLLFRVQEYCDLGTLRDYVVTRLGLPGRLGEPEAMARLLQLLHDSATGLAALHDAKVVHGDLVRLLRQHQDGVHQNSTSAISHTHEWSRTRKEAPVCVAVITQI